MQFFEVAKQVMSGERLSNLPLRVCFYARVSTDSDVQLNSLDNQLNYYVNYIKSNPNWTYVNGYVDEGISGVRVEKRDGFKRMIRDAKLNKFDLIITKEVSRFARDLEDSIHYIRKLKNANVGIFFENQNLNTFDSNSELLLNIMFNLAQDESRKLSSRVKFGHRQAIEKGHVLGSSNITGYKKEKCKLVIDKEESKFIVKLFELYATGEYGFYKLAKTLGDMGYKNKKGHFYDKDSLKRMISNPKYKGFYRGKTTEIVDYRTKQRKKIDEENQVIYKCTDGTIPAIVSEELWNKANEILKSRTKNYFDNNYYTGGLKYPLSSKIYCKEHNHNFQRSHGRIKSKRPTWSCGMYLKYKLDACASPIISEKDMLSILGKIFNTIILNKETIINDMIDIYKNIGNSNNYQDEIETIKKNINNVESKKALALDLVLNNYLIKEQLKEQFIKFDIELEKLNSKLDEIKKQVNIVNENNSNLSKISSLIQEEIKGGCLDDFIRKFIDEIIVSKVDNDRNNIKLDIYLNLLGYEKKKIHGARHINGKLEDEIIYLENIKCNTIEKLKSCVKPNSFIYNVYIENVSKN